MVKVKKVTKGYIITFRKKGIKGTNANLNEVFRTKASAIRASKTNRPKGVSNIKIERREDFRKHFKKIR